MATKKVSFKSSVRKIFEIPLNMISENPGNPGDFRDQEVIPILYEQGYRIFPRKNVSNDKVLWLMLNGELGQSPDKTLRAEAVHLITEHEQNIVDIAKSLDTALVHPVHIIVKKNGAVGIESGLVRAFAQSYRYALKNKPVGTISAEVVYNPKEEDIQARATIENLHVIVHRPIALAHRCKLLRTLGWKFDKIAESIGRTPQTVRNYLELSKLPHDIQMAVADNKLTMSQAIEMQRESKKTGKDIDEVVDETLPVSIDELAKKPTSKKHKLLTWNKVLVLYSQESDTHTKEVLLEVLQISGEEASKILAENMMKQIDLSGFYD